MAITNSKQLILHFPYRRCIFFARLPGRSHHIKFTVSKNDLGKDLSVSGVENFTLYDKKGIETSFENLAAGTYTLELKLDGSESTSYTLALA